MTPFLLLGEARRAAIAKYVRECVERWQRNWSGQADDVDVEVYPGHFTSWSTLFSGEHDAADAGLVAQYQAAACFYAHVADAAPLSIVVPLRCLPAVVGLQGVVLESVERGLDNDSLAACLEDESLEVLARLLGGSRLSVAALQRSVTPAGEMLRELGARRQVVVLVRFLHAKSSLLVLLPAELVASMGPARSEIVSAEPMQRRMQALAEKTVGVEVVLGHIELSVSELAALEVGDVIVMEEQLSALGDLVIAPDRRIGRTALGRINGKRAVQLKGDF